jgi:flagellar basal-body rod protein FlgG
MVHINATGNITVDGTGVGSIDVVDFPKPYQLQKTGKAHFVPADPQAVPQSVPRVSVMQGYIEDSNVNAIAEMTHMIECNRSFESCQRVIRSYDEMAGKAIELGKS